MQINTSDILLLNMALLAIHEPKASSRLLLGTSEAQHHTSLITNSKTHIDKVGKREV